MTRQQAREKVADLAAASVWASVDAALAATDNSKNLKEGIPPSRDGHLETPTPTTNQPAARPNVAIVIEAKVIQFSAGAVFSCAVLELDDGFRFPAMLRPADGHFAVGDRVRASKPHGGFLTWTIAAL